MAVYWRPTVEADCTPAQELTSDWTSCGVTAAILQRREGATRVSGCNVGSARRRDSFCGSSSARACRRASRADSHCCRWSVAARCSTGSGGRAVAVRRDGSRRASGVRAVERRGYKVTVDSSRATFRGSSGHSPVEFRHSDSSERHVWRIRARIVPVRRAKRFRLSITVGVLTRQLALRQSLRVLTEASHCS
jgi:hypothetical protein